MPPVKKTLRRYARRGKLFFGDTKRSVIVINTDVLKII